MRKIFIILLLAALPSLGLAQYRCFFGNLHAHTSYSDGESTPDTAFAYARDIALIDIQALTEHNNGGMNNGVSYTITPEHYQNLRLVADTMTVPGVFVALAGFEIGSMGSSGFGHLNVWETEALSPYFNTAGDLQNCYRWIKEKGCPALFNHPDSGRYQNSNFNDFYFYQEYEKSMDLIEILNGSTLYEDAYFRALERGWRLGPSANQDNHQRDWGHRVNSAGNIPLTGVWADTLTKQAVLEALNARRTTAVEVSPDSDRFLLSLKVDGYWQGSTILRGQGEASFEISAVSDTSAFSKIYLYSNGAIVDSLSPGSRVVNWTFKRQLKSGSQYYFAKAVQNDGDRAWTSPVFIDVYAESRYKVYTWPTPIRDQAKIVYPPLEGATELSVRIYDLAGNLIWSREDAVPGQAVDWDVRDRCQRPVPNGIYIILVQIRSPQETKSYSGKTMVTR